MMTPTAFAPQPRSTVKCTPEAIRIPAGVPVGWVTNASFLGVGDGGSGGGGGGAGQSFRVVLTDAAAPAATNRAAVATSLKSQGGSSRISEKSAIPPT